MKIIQLLRAAWHRLFGGRVKVEKVPVFNDSWREGL